MTNHKILISEPFISGHLSILRREANHGVLESVSINMNDMLISNDSCADSLLRVGRPPDLRRSSFDYERVLEGVSFIVRDSEEFILGTSYQMSAIVPVSISDFLAVFRDARNPSLRFPVEENERTLFSSYTENRVGLGPTYPTGFVFL